MGLNTTGSVPDISDRFGIAQDGPTPNDIEIRQRLQWDIRAQIYRTAKNMADSIEGGRELSLALTHLEEALMWAGKAIFK